MPALLTLGFVVTSFLKTCAPRSGMFKNGALGTCGRDGLRVEQALAGGLRAERPVAPAAGEVRARARGKRQAA